MSSIGITSRRDSRAENPDEGVAEDNGQPSSSDPGFIHRDKIALVDKRGVVRAYYDGMDASTPQTVLAGIKQLLTESKTH